MNCRLLSLSLATAAVLGGSQLAHAQDVKIGLVDFARLQREFYRTDMERKNFEEKRGEERTKVDDRRNKFKELLKEQENASKALKDPTLSGSKKDQVVQKATERAGQISSLQKETIELETRINAELAQKANEIQRSLTQEIYSVIGQVAEGKGYDLVFNRTFGINGVPTVAFSSTKTLVDLTDEVAARLNENAPEGWTPPKEGSGEIKAE